MLWWLDLLLLTPNYTLLDPNLFEGDMILSPDQLEEIRNGKINRAVPMAATKTNLWPRKIPFDYHELSE